jgi:tetraacyldisaccharide 4'-kinase
MRAPGFWEREGLPAALLAPAAAVWTAGAARRAARPGWQAPVPVICCGNATVGGAGKTTLALDLGARLARRGARPAFLTRGYGGRASGVLRVDPERHDAALVGDEPLLLAGVAPTYVAADRAAAARAAIAAGATVLVMDDGLQNPSLAKTLALLVVDGASGFGNGRVLPAGPLREPVAAAASRAQAAVLIGADRTGAARLLPPELPVLRAELAPVPDIAALVGRPVLAFAGIARPEKFFAMLEQAGVTVALRRPFPDHHRYGAAEVPDLLEAAARQGLVAVTTPKDAARLAPALGAAVTVVGVRLVWQDEAAIERLLG